MPGRAAGGRRRVKVRVKVKHRPTGESPPAGLLLPRGSGPGGSGPNPLQLNEEEEAEVVETTGLSLITST